MEGEEVNAEGLRKQLTPAARIGSGGYGEGEVSSPPQTRV